MPKMTDAQVLSELKSNSKINMVRAAFSSEANRIEQACMQRRAPSPIELRRMEFDAARKIAAALGVEI